MPLRRMIRSFIDPVDARTAANLTRQLADFEDNVAAECDDIRASSAARVKSVARSVRASTLQLAPGQSAGFDTSAGNVEVLLSRPTAKDDGKFIVVLKRFATNQVIMRAPSGVLIDGTDSASKSAVGLAVIFCDGEGYWT